MPASPIAAPEVEPARPVSNAAARAAARASAGPSALLTAKAQNEYVYVSGDLRRIATFAGLIAGAMVVLWLLLDVMKVVSY